MGSNTLLLDLGLEPLEEGLKRLMAIPEAVAAANQGAGEVGIQFLTDCLEEVPETSTPMLTGALRGSGSAFINGDLIITSAQLGYEHEEGTPATKLFEPDFDRDKHTITVVFNRPYAARVHEMPLDTNWTTPGSAGKYIEPLKSEGEKYMRMWFEAIKEMMLN